MKKKLSIIGCVIAIVVSLISCNGNPPEIEPADLSMYVGETIELPIEFAPWTSSNPFIAEVVDGNRLVSHHVGRIELHSQDSSCIAAVEPHYTFAPYDEPILDWTMTKKEVRKILGSPSLFNDSHADAYHSDADNLVIYYYDYDDDTNLLQNVRLENTSTKCVLKTEDIIKIMEERYELIKIAEGELSGRYACDRLYANCWPEKYEEDKSNATIFVTFFASGDNFQICWQPNHPLRFK